MSKIKQLSITTLHYYSNKFLQIILANAIFRVKVMIFKDEFNNYTV